MRITLTVNGRHVITNHASGFDVEKFTGVRLNILRSVSRWTDVFNGAKKDLAIVVGLVNKYQGMAKDLAGDVKSSVPAIASCWEASTEAEDTQHPTRLMMLSVMSNFEAIIKYHINDFNIGNNAVMLDSMFNGGAFRSIALTVELTEDEEEEFGVSKTKLLMLRIRKGVHISKVRKGDTYVYGLNLDMVCPSMNFVALLYGHPQLISIIAPMVACYIKEVEEAMNFFMKSWDTVKNPELTAITK